ncbi:MAG: flavodoxin family protein [Leucothrix sp.]
MKPLLIIANTPSKNALSLRNAVQRGAQASSIGVLVKPPLQATAEDVLSSSGIIIGTTENFGYMSGQVKDFFERIYYPCLDNTEALPWALYIKAGLDGTGATLSVEKIVTGLKWKAVQAPLLLHGPFQDSFIEDCETLGAGMAEGLKLGIF